MGISEIAIRVDRTCDYIPVVSTFSNSIVLAQKIIFLCCSPETVSNNRYWSYIRDKDLFYTVLLLVPVVGNIIYIAVIMCSNNDVEPEELPVPYHISTEVLTSLSRQIPGNGDLQVNAMQPAETLEQRQLWAGCHQAKLPMVKKLLESGVNPNFFHRGQTPLTTACEDGTADIIRLLLQSKANANQADRFQEVPLVLAAASGDVEKVKAVFEKSNDVNRADSMGHTALMMGCHKGKQDIVEFLIAHKADLSIKGADCMDAFTHALDQGHDHLIPSLFAPGSLNSDKLSYDLRSHMDDALLHRLHEADKCCHADLEMEYFEDYSHDGEEVREDGEVEDNCLSLHRITPLMYAVYMRAIPAAKQLMNLGDVTLRDKSNRNVLHYIAIWARGNTELTEIAMSRCPRKNLKAFLACQDSYGQTPLHLFMHPHTQMDASVLLRAGADFSKGLCNLDKFARKLIKISNEVYPEFCNLEIWQIIGGYADDENSTPEELAKQRRLDIVLDEIKIIKGGNNQERAPIPHLSLNLKRSEVEQPSRRAYKDFLKDLPLLKVDRGQDALFYEVTHTMGKFKH